MKKQNKMVSFKTAVKNFWTKYFDFRGTTTRAEYWWSVLFVIVVALILASLTRISGAFFVVAYIFALVVICPGIMMTVRRFRDAGWDVRWYLYPMVAVLAMNVLTVLFAGWRDMAVMWATIGTTVDFAAALLTLFVAVQPSVHRVTKKRK